MGTHDMEWLQSWYSINATPSRRHSYGIKIETLDNPGWAIYIDLHGTALEVKPYKSFDIEISEDDWIACRIKEGVFEGFCGPMNFIKMVSLFRNWAES